MRIAFVLSEWPSSSETFVAAQISGLVERGHEVHVFADAPAVALAASATGAAHQIRRPLHVSGGSRVRRWAALLRLLSGIGPAGLGGFARALRFGRHAAVTALTYGAACRYTTHRYDIVHAHFGPNGIAAAAMRAAGVVSGRLVVTFHGYDLSQYLRERGERVYDGLFEDVDLCLPVTERWERRLIQLGCDAGRVIVHRMGVKTCGQPESPRPASSLVRVLTTARLVEKKGVEYAIRAVARLAREIPLNYVIAGDGPERPRLEALTRELGITDCVSLLGWRSEAEIQELLSCSDVFMLPSITARSGDEEGLPVALMEAMCAGLPVLSTKHSGIPELVSDGVEGFLVAERDVDALAHRLAQLSRDDGMRRRMGSAARLRIAERHDSRILNDELVGIYEDLIGAQSSSPAAGQMSEYRR
jgi:colanic acid/amylovoran biosynthesis glycosyltransferase